MSLVITSNTPKNDITEITNGINQSFSYTNHLQGTLRIPANSQIAVQSVKINKDGNVIINKYNSKFGFYFGRPANTWGARKYDINNNSFMIPGFVLPPEDRERNMSLSPTDLAVQIQKSFKTVLNCPNLCETSGITPGAENPGPLVVPMRSASQQGFTGFQWSITQTPNASSTFISTKWSNFSELPDSAAPTVVGTTIENPSTTGFICVNGTEYPLNLAGGGFNCSLGTHADPGNEDYEEFSIGLSRDNSLSLPSQGPPYWSPIGSPTGIFFDWRIASVESTLPAHLGRHEIRVYHSVWDAGFGFTEVEFEYWNNVAGPRAAFGGNGNDGMIWEDEEFGEVRFTVSNERVKIFLTGTAGDKIITDGTMGGDSGGNQNMKPSGPTTRWLFPKLILAKGKNMKIIKWSGIPVKDYVYGIPNNKDWQLQEMANGDFSNLQLLDDSLIAYYNATGLQYADILYNQQTIHGFGAMGCEAKIVSSPQRRYFLGEKGLNSENIFGFKNQGNASPIEGDKGSEMTMKWQSSSVPLFVSKESVFIRLKNFPIISANFSKSALSNILYHIPTFSNSGQETGSLHFEPSEMVYLDINNTEDIFISTMEVDLVYGDETLAQGIAGKTTVVFHIRSGR
tara:strand:- start:473 stop:2347 length:1875 start_codon:yes stop_codon:yes gene_type:complete